MTRLPCRWSLVILGVLVCTACGEDLPTAPPHGLEVATPDSQPHGEAIRAYGTLQPGAWSAVVEKEWTEVRDGGEPRHGRAVLDLRLRRLQEGDTFRSTVEVVVVETEGIATEYVRRFDGLRASVTHDEAGRPDPATLRFDGSAPAEARSFLSGFWVVGLLGAMPWFPPGPLREGQAWSRERLGTMGVPTTLGTRHRIAPRVSGGGRLEAVRVEGGETVLDIHLDGLVEASGAGRTAGGSEAVDFGMRNRGMATFRARDGLPLHWQMEERVRLSRVVNGVESLLDVTLEVRGHTRPLPHER